MADDSPQKFNPNRPIDLFDDGYPRRPLEEQPELSEHEQQQLRHEEDPSPVDQELAAIKKVVEALSGLTRQEQERVLRWAVSRFVR